jgi:putative membrane protein
VLAPVIATDDARLLARAVDPLTTYDTPLERHPGAARTRRLVRAVAAPALLCVVTGALQWWWPATILLALGVAGVPLGLDRYRQLGHAFDGHRLVISEGSVSRRRTSLDPRAVVSYSVERSPGQERTGLCTVVLHLGQGAGSRRVLDCSEEQAATMLAALDVPLFAPFIAGSSTPVHTPA